MSSPPHWEKQQSRLSVTLRFQSSSSSQLKLSPSPCLALRCVVNVLEGSTGTDHQSFVVDGVKMELKEVSRLKWMPLYVLLKPIALGAHVRMPQTTRSRRLV